MDDGELVGLLGTYISSYTFGMTVPDTFDVAILGFGPTGSTLANLLGCWSSANQKPISVLVRK